MSLISWSIERILPVKYLICQLKPQQMHLYKQPKLMLDYCTVCCTCCGVFFMQINNKNKIVVIVEWWARIQENFIKKFKLELYVANQILSDPREEAPRLSRGRIKRVCV